MCEGLVVSTTHLFYWFQQLLSLRLAFLMLCLYYTDYGLSSPRQSLYYLHQNCGSWSGGAPFVRISRCLSLQIFNPSYFFLNSYFVILSSNIIIPSKLPFNFSCYLSIHASFLLAWYAFWNKSPRSLACMPADTFFSHSVLPFHQQSSILLSSAVPHVSLDRSSIVLLLLFGDYSCSAAERWASNF